MFTLQEREHPITQLISGAASLATSGLGGFIENQRNQRESADIMKMLSNTEADASPLEVAKQIEALNIRPEKKEMLRKTYTELTQLDQKKKASIAASEKEDRANKRQEAKDALDQKKFEAEQEKELRARQSEESERNALAKLNRGEELTPQEEASLSAASQRARFTTIEKKKEKLNQAKTEARQDVLKAQQGLKTVDELRNLIPKMKEGWGLGGFNPLSENATRFNTLSLAAAEPFVKLYNPTGPIATQKMKLIVDNSTPKAWEPKGVQLGKLATLETLAKNGLERAQLRLQLLEQGATDEQLEKFDEESVDLAETISNYENGKIQNQAEASEAVKYKDGHRKKNKHTGETIEFRGGQWIPVQV